MSNLNRRVEKLEKQTGVDEGDRMDRDKHPAIVYSYYEEDGEAGAEAARKKAVEEWEAENGPLDGREPYYFSHCLVSPPPKEAEQKSGTDMDSAPGTDAMQEPETKVTPFLAR